MLTRNCVKMLFEDTDINIPVTIFNPTAQKEYIRREWFVAIKDSLGQNTLNSEQIYTFQITSIKGKIYTLRAAGCHLIEELHNLFLYKNPMSIRIDILEDSDRSWIILVKSEI